MKNLDFEKLAFEFQTTDISLTKIAKREGTTRQTLAKYFKKMGIEVINKQNRTKFDANVFDKIDSEEKAYWLGFIFADGSIRSYKEGEKPTYTLEISLKGSDYEHLIKFSKFIKHENQNLVTISDAKCGETICKRCRLYITNKHLWEILNNYGCTPQKSLTLQFPNLNIFNNSELIRHFIRGYFDGDGCFSRQVYKTIVTPTVSILGTPEFLNSIQELLPFENSTYFCHDKRHTDRTYSLIFHKEEGIKFINYLYSDAIVYLDRKYKLYEFFKDGSRSIEEFMELQSGNIGETPLVDNPEISSEIKESEPSYSVETEPILEVETE